MAVEIGIGNASPSKTITVRRQMRTRRERTSGAWMRGCELNPGGEHGKLALQATSTATPNNTQGAWKEQLLFKTLGEPVPCQTQQA